MRYYRPGASLMQGGGTTILLWGKPFTKGFPHKRGPRPHPPEVSSRSDNKIAFCLRQVDGRDWLP